MTTEKQTSSKPTTITLELTIYREISEEETQVLVKEYNKDNGTAFFPSSVWAEMEDESNLMHAVECGDLSTDDWNIDAEEYFHWVMDNCDVLEDDPKFVEEDCDE